MLQTHPAVHSVCLLKCNIREDYPTGLRAKGRELVFTECFGR